MASYKKVVYIVGSNTICGDLEFMTIRLIADNLGDEEGNQTHRYGKVASQIHQFGGLFNLKRIRGRKYYKLSPQGTRLFDRIKDVFDPVLDKLLIQPDEIEVI